MAALTPSDLKLHDTVLRLLKGIVNAYDAWLTEQKQPRKTPS